MRILSYLKFKWFIEKARHPIRPSIDVYNRMAEHHSLFLKFDREKDIEVAKKEKIKRDMLKWVLYLNEED